MKLFLLDRNYPFVNKTIGACYNKSKEIQHIVGYAPKPPANNLGWIIGIGTSPSIYHTAASRRTATTYT